MFRNRSRRFGGGAGGISNFTQSENLLRPNPEMVALAEEIARNNLQSRNVDPETPNPEMEALSALHAARNAQDQYELEQDPRALALTQGMTDTGDNMFLDSQGNWHTIGEQDPVPGQWMWTEEGLVPIGGSTEHEVTPFMDILEQYRGGQPIDALTWQDALRKSVEGFMRTIHVAPPRSNISTTLADPATIWDPNVAGLPGSAFRIGTLQELVEDETIPGLFFDTGGARQAINDIVMTQNPDGRWPTAAERQQVANLEAQIRANPAQGPALAQAFQDANPGLFDNFSITTRWVDPDTGMPIDPNAFDPLLGMMPSDQLLVFEDVPVGGALEKILGPISTWLPNSDQDFNDFIFKANLARYAPPPELIKASPQSVMQKFFDTPAYQLAFGTGDVTDASLGPRERFRADPGYQFQQEEGQRQLMMGHAARGLLESGPSLRDVTRYSQGLADQAYQRKLQQDVGMFSDYQNRLQGIATQGAAFAQPNPAIQTGAGLATIGQNQGSNLANLFGNQGTFGGSAFLNTGAAQASTVMQAASLQAQVMQANQQAQAASQAGGGGGGGLGQIGQIAGMLGGLF